MISQVYIKPQTKVVIIWSSTTRGVDPLSDSVFARLSSLSRTTIRDLEAKDKAPHVLKLLFQLNVPAVLLGEEANRDIFQNRAERPAGGDEADWQRFYERYPNSPGILFFSRVGVNPQRTKLW